MNLLKPDYRKATQVANFFARVSSDNIINEMKALKLTWAADRYHLRKYGRPVVGDRYVAMRWGSVASKVKDIIEDSIVLVDNEKRYRSKFITMIDKHNLKSLHEVDDNFFSVTDLEALNFAYEEFGSMREFELSELTHKYPEWERYKERLESGSSECEVMSYSDFFENPKNITNDKFMIDKDTLQSSKEILLESEKLKQLLQ
jgi:uncharacterized phage-associated protein